MPPSRSLPAKKQQLTLAQLASYDDIITDALVDHVFYWTTIPKNRPSYHASRGVKEDEIANIIQKHLVVDPDLDVAEGKLLATAGLKKFCDSLKTGREKDDFKRHLRRYMQIYLPDCPFEVNSTNRYTIYTHEASITARKFVRRGQTVKYLAGTQVVITPEEEAELSKRKKDFSIVVSSRSKCANLFMGPARFANHDCGANAKLMTTGQAGIEIIATKDIDVGDEITVTYGENYFGDDNCECLCQNCEDNLVNGWAQAGGRVPVKKSIEEDVVRAAQGYSLRRRRRDDSVNRAGSETPSVTPDIRPRVRKTKPKHPTLLAGRSSTSDSLDPDQSHGPLKGRKRDLEALATPPITPAKKQKTTHYHVEPIPLAASSRGSSADETGSTASSSAASKGGALTDVTSPEAESPGPIIHSPKPTPIRREIRILRQESALRTTGDALASVGQVLESVEPADSPCRTINEGSSFRRDRSAKDRFAFPSIPSLLIHPMPDTPATVFIPQIRNASADSGLAPTATGRRPEQSSLEITVSGVQEPPTGTSSAPSAQLSTSMSGAEIVETTSVATSDTPASSLPTPRKRGVATSSASPQDVAEQRQESPPPKRRTPRDYTLTPILLSEPEAAWIYCRNCNTAFVQREAYYTRSSCPRCERHSKIYGYIWPKTEREGKHDAEERILDHRTIHRFLDAGDEAKIRGRQLPKWKTKASSFVAESPVPQAQRVPMKLPKQMAGRKRRTGPDCEASEAEPEADEALAGLRRSGRVRRASAKVAPVG